MEAKELPATNESPDHEFKEVYIRSYVTAFCSVATVFDLDVDTSSS
jgi:hypothetical protein